jgi:threonine dehydrogenase-like Zn-dependent dehydrogenase
MVVDEITMIGSRCGPFQPAIQLLKTGWVDPRPLISARYPLLEGPAAFEHAGRKGALKVLLDHSPLD